MSERSYAIAAHGKRLLGGIPSLLKFEKNSEIRAQRLAEVRDLVQPSKIHPNYAPQPGSTFLAVCHDQEIDRRILHQIEALIGQGWNGIIVALSMSVSDDFDRISLAGKSVPIHRIGQGRIIPDCTAYWAYQRRQSYLANNPLIGRLNWEFYKLHLRYLYRCRMVTHPLPFDSAFLAAGKHYPAKLVLAHDLTALKAGAELASSWNARLIYDSHEYYPEQKVFSSRQKALMRAYEKTYVLRCDRILTVSDSIANAMARENELDRIPDTLTNVTTRPVLGEREILPLRVRIGAPESDRIILYQGGMVRNRNLPVLVKGFLELGRPDVRLIFLGPRDPNFARELRAIANRSPIGKRVHFLDPVPQSELLQLTRTADFGVIPYAPIDLNTKYCMPNKLFEFIQAELPVLANSHLEEVGSTITKTGIGKIWPMNDPHSTAIALEVMLEKDLEEYRGPLAVAAKEYSWEAEEARYLRIIDEVMNSGSISTGQPETAALSPQAV